MDNLPADWAIEAALTRVTGEMPIPEDVVSDWSVAGVKKIPATYAVTVLELARMIEKYEAHLTPVDPDVLAVREILSSVYAADDQSVDAGKYADGTYDNDRTFIAALEAYRKVKTA